MGRVQLINLPEDELDRALFRIYPIWFFESALVVNGGNLALVPPSVWEDPCEDPSLRMQMMAPAPGRAQKPLSGYLQPTYAQCWSFEGRSDSLMRAYSRVTKDPVFNKNIEPRLEGVKVRTTPRLLAVALEKFLDRRGNNPFEFYIAKVEYVDEPVGRVHARLNEVGPTRLGSGFDRARSLTFKRRAFEHEQEVRIIALAKPGTDAKWIALDIDKNEVFQEVQFDPRLSEAERKDREQQVRALGYTGEINMDGIYANAIYLTELVAHWDELDAKPTAN